MMNANSQTSCGVQDLTSDKLLDLNTEEWHEVLWQLGLRIDTSEADKNVAGCNGADPKDPIENPEKAYTIVSCDAS
jgi:hypothetical protein